MNKLGRPLIRHAAALAMFTSLLVPAASAQKIYKYVDADGNTIYSQRVPQGVEATEIKPRVRKVSPEEAREQLQALGERARRQGQGRELERQAAEVDAENARRMRENCAQARKNLDILTGSARVQSTDARGNFFYLDDASRQAKLKEARAQVEAFCK